MNNEKTIIKVGTRGSKLAIKQAELACRKIEEIMGLPTKIVCISTHGDEDKKTPLQKMKKSGIFVKKIEAALLDHKIDVAAHSLKDMESAADERLMVIGYADHEDKRDALLTHDHETLMTLKKDAAVATGSLRRQACIHRVRPDIRFIGVRGNIETRIKNFEQSSADGLVLAVAGLKRLNLHERIDEILDPSVVIPACGQGTVAMQIRQEDAAFFDALKTKDASFKEVQIEREFLALCKAGCHQPVGCCIRIREHEIQADACFGLNAEDCSFIHETYRSDQIDEVAADLVCKIQEKRR